MKKIFILVLSLGFMGCDSQPEWDNVNSVSWSKALAFTECKKNGLTGTPGCAVSINDYSSSVHTHIIETDKQRINVGEFITISRYKGKTKNDSSRIDNYKIVEIQKEGDRCRLIINPIKYQDVYLTVDNCKN